MNALSPKKLLNSKWTAVKPQRKEKHFLISEVEYDENGKVTHCLIEAVITKRSFSIQWQTLEKASQWVSGWL